MIIYHTVSTYHILRSILHKINYRSQENAVILVPKRFLNLPYGLREKSDVFSKIIYYDWEFKKYQNYPEDIFKEIENVLVNEIGKDYKEQIKEYNIFYAARFFGSFLATRDIHFNWFEEADGRYLKYEPPMFDDKRMYPERYRIASELGLYMGESECIDTIYLSLDDNPGVKENDKIKNFDVQNELMKLSEDDKEELMRFWGVKKDSILVPDNSALLLSQHFCNIKIISFEEQVLLYQMFVDYFLTEYKLFLKMHPSDNFPYEEFLSDIENVRVSYPAELMQFAIRGKFDIIASISSTGILNLKNISDKQICINQEYSFNFRDSDLYYFAAKLYLEFTDYSLQWAGIDGDILNTMLYYSVKCKKSVDIKMYSGSTYIENTILIINENVDEDLLRSINEAYKKNVIICILSQKGSVYELNLIKSSLSTAKKIVSNSMRDNELITEKRVILVSDNIDNIKVINDMKYYRLLKNTELIVRVDKNDDKQAQVLALEGMLEATEKTLEYYVKENKLLLDKIAEREI